MFKPNATMKFVHMIITYFATLKNGHTRPANMCITASASYVIAAFCLLHWCFAFWTIFDVEFFLQFSPVPHSHPAQCLYTLRKCKCRDVRGSRYRATLTICAIVQ